MTLGPFDMSPSARARPPGRATGIDHAGPCHAALPRLPGGAAVRRGDAAFLAVIGSVAVAELALLGWLLAGASGT